MATSPVIRRAVDPVADVIMAMRPPTTAMVRDRQNAPNRPTLGSTPAMPEKAMASGIIAKATTKPDSRSLLGFENHWFTRVGLERLAIDRDAAGSADRSSEGWQVAFRVQACLERTKAWQPCTKGPLKFLMVEGQMIVDLGEMNPRAHRT